MGFPNPPKNEQDLPSITSQVLRNAYTDVLLIKHVNDFNKFTLKRIGIYLQDHENLHLMLMAVTALAENNNARITLCGFLPDDYNKRQKIKVDQIILSALETIKTTALYNTTIITTSDIQQEIISLSTQFDLLVLAKEQEKIAAKNIEQSTSFQIARQVKCSVLMVKSIGYLKRLVKRL